MFLTGVLASFARTPRKKLSFFLMRRSRWIIAVEFVVLTFAIKLDPLYHLLIFK
jgi:hypothetical protein